MLKTSHRPDGKNAYALALILACTTAANASCHLPQWEFLLICPIDSHLSIRIDIWFYQGIVRASHACKLPIAPMGFSHVLRSCLQGGGVYVLGGSVTFSSCTIAGNTATNNVRAKVRKFPSPRWETC